LKKRDDCEWCKDPYGGRAVLKRGRTTEGIDWVVLPIDTSSVSKGRHLILTTTSHHVGAQEVDARRKLLPLAYDLGLEILGKNFRLLLNQGTEASSADHFHAHLIMPGQGERLVRAAANIPSTLDQFVESGHLSREAADTIKEKIVQKAS